MWRDKTLKPGSNLKVEDLLKELRARYEELTSYRRVSGWRLLQGDEPEAYRLEYDDSGWEVVELPMKVDIRRGGCWLRCKVKVPSRIAGIDVEGSTATLSSSPIISPGGSEIYVNSRSVLSERYWTELRGARITLSEDVKPGDTFLIAIHIEQGYEPINIPAIIIKYSRVEDVAFEIDSFINQLLLIKDLRRDVTVKLLREFNIEALSGDLKGLIKEVRRVKAILLEASESAKRFKVHLVGHAHMDMNWLWNWGDTVNMIRRTFKTVLDLMKRSPDLHFSQSQAVTYNVVEEGFPELFEAVKRKIEEGCWEVTASTWVEGDLNMGGTEALVRQILYAKRYVRERFGVEPEICWEPDTFGHVWTYPQILRKSGIKYYYFMRCGRGYPIFWWEGPDGSKVLAFTSVYNNVVTPGNILEISRRVHKSCGLETSMFVYGVGDHGGGPTMEDIEVTHRIQKEPAMPSVIFSSAQEFFREVERELRRLGDGSIPTVRDELNFVFDGCYTTHSDIKRYNRLCERLLVDAEKLCIMAGEYPVDSIRKAWLKVLFNQFHDILCGSGIHEAYEYPLKLAREASETAKAIIKASMGRIARGIRFSRGLPIVVFNTLPWDRVDVVRVNVQRELIPEKPVALTSDGEVTPVQVVGDTVLFIARVPSMGYRTYYLTQGEAEGGSLAKGLTLENKYFKVELDGSSGSINSMYDKVNDRFVFKKVLQSATRPEPSNLIQVLYEAPHPMSAWIIGEITRIENLTRGAEVELLEEGPVRATVRVVHKVRNSEITQLIHIYRELPRLDFYTIIDWRETSNEKVDAPMLKAAFTPILREPRATFEIPYGYIERPRDGREVPALRWIDLSDGEYGVSLLNDSKYGFDVKGNTMRITLIRTSYSPDVKPDYGRHEVLYSIYPHKGDWREAQTFRRGYEVNHPLEALVIEASTVGGSTPDTQSFVQVEPENVVLSCMKRAEDSEDVIIRVYDATGDGGDVKITFKYGVKEACEVDLMERPIGPVEVRGETLMFKIKPFEIKTLKITPQTKPKD